MGGPLAICLAALDGDRSNQAKAVLAPRTLALRRLLMSAIKNAVISDGILPFHTNETAEKATDYLSEFVIQISCAPTLSG